MRYGKEANKTNYVFPTTHQRAELLVRPSLSTSPYFVYKSMATTRLRRAFRYPEDSDDERGREELDEEGLFDPAIDPFYIHIYRHSTDTNWQNKNG